MSAGAARPGDTSGGDPGSTSLDVVTGIVQVTCPVPLPGLDTVHVYLAEGAEGGLVLVDTSMGWEDSMDRISSAVSRLGRSLEDLERIVLTHAHPDHVALARDLQGVSGAPVVCHPIAERGLDAMQQPGRWGRMAEIYTEHGLTSQGETGGGFRMPKPDRIEHVEAGEEVVLAGDRWEVHWTPGHEWGHIVLFRPRDRTLLAGDTLLAGITPHIGYMLEPEDPLGQFLDSLDLLAELDPALVLPGHKRVFDRGAARARAIRAHHEQRLRRARELLGRDGPATAVEVARGLFGRDLRFFQERLALSETLAHLEYLRLRGHLDREMADGLWFYREAG